MHDGPYPGDVRQEGAPAPSPAAPATEADGQYLRLAADFDNYRKRVARDAQDDRDRAAGRATEAILPVADALDRAMEHSGGNGELEAIRSLMLSSLSSLGNESIDPLREPFDPRTQRALAFQPSAEVPADHVLAVIRTGWRRGGTLIRPADVVISSGPPTG